VSRTIGARKAAGLIYLVVIGVMAFTFWKLPTGFLPEEDIGVLFTIVQGPSGATLPATDKALDSVRDYFLTKEKDNVVGVFTVGGFSFSGQGQNAGIAFVNLKPWDNRKGKANTAQGIAQRGTGPLIGSNRGRS